MWEWGRRPEEGDARWYETKGMHDLRQAYAIAVREAPAAIYRETGYAVSEFLKDILPALLDICMVQAASTAIGAGVGGALGSLAGGVGAVPGAAYGAGVGFSVGATLLSWLGLAFLFIAVKQNIGEVVVLVQLAVKQAWHAAEHPISRSAQVQQAGLTLARAMGRLMLLVLQAVVAWLLKRGMSNASELYADLRKSKLGDGFTTWVEQNIERLRNDAKLQPRQVERSTAKETAEVKALTPSQLVKMQEKTLEPGARVGDAASRGQIEVDLFSEGRSFVAPNGSVVKLPNAASMSNVDVRMWYLRQEATIPELVAPDADPQSQAMQAHELRNTFRTAARTAMQDQDAAAQLSATNPNLTWEQVVAKYSQSHSGDDLWQQIISASQRSRASVNQQLGVVPPGAMK